MPSTESTTLPDLIQVASLDELKQKKVIVVSGNDGPIAVFHHDDGQVHAVDNRCPHMGFPLHRGTIKDGILTCHWHHADFDLESGCTFDLFADDVPTYAVEMRNGDVWVARSRDQSGDVDYWKKRLQEGLEQNISLVIAKAVIALLKAGISYRDISEVGGRYGVRYRRAGWGPGLTILSAMTNVCKYLPVDEQILPLYQGLGHVARDSNGEPPRFDLQPLDTENLTYDTLKRWFRRFVEVRDSDGATRCLLTAAQGSKPAMLVDMMMSAATDHVFINGGHVLDFINKASELLDHIGWEQSGLVLPSLVSQLCSAQRNEELNAWRHPVDLSAILRAAKEALPSALNTSPNGYEWLGPEALADVILGEDPQATVDTMLDHLRQGLAPLQLSQAVTYAAAMRVARFHTQNEFGDWITVLHTFTYANALHQALKRTNAPDLVRGVFHGAMAVYLDRFLNIPPARLPGEREAITGPEDADEILKAYLVTLDTQQQVEQAAQLIARYLSLGHPTDRLFRTFAESLLREDAEFHSFQMLEAGIQQYEELQGTEAANHILMATTRYLAAHAPTQRALNQTVQIALRLHRGEAIYEEE